MEKDGDSDGYIRNHIKESLEELKDALGGEKQGIPTRGFKGISRSAKLFSLIF
jgi:hypothetical protein